MKMLSVLLLFGVAAAADPKRCCTPMQWESYVDTSAGSVRGYEPHSLYLGVARVHLDATKKMIAGEHEVFENGERTFYRIVDNFVEKKRFFVMDDFCVIRPLEEDFREPCIPSEAYPTRNHTLGVGADSLRIQGWGLREGGLDMHFHVTDKCIPVNRAETYEASDIQRDTSFVTFYAYNDVTAGIRDESVFETPKECRAVKYEMKSKEFVFLKRAMKVF